MRIRRPDGLNVVLLGPDGAGKSSVIDAVGPRLAPVFSRWECWGFAPALHRLVRPQGVTNHPHELPPRSLLVSVLRAAYWLAYNTIGYASLYWALARSTLVVHDRHFMDIFVDQKRYRYGGPMWLLRLIWRVMAKPDLIILLDAPPEVLQSRKQEVPFQETARQRAAYLALMRTVRNHYIVDAGQPFETVLGAANQIILDHLSTRLLSRTALERSLPMVPMTQLERE
jgi:thymidylate kinase